MLVRCITLGAGVLVAVGCLTAQVKQQKTAPKAPEFISVTKMIDTRVVFAVDATKTGKTGGGQERVPKLAGTVQDFVLDTEHGITKFVAVAAAKKTRAVPLDKIRWTGDSWSLALGEAEYRKLRVLPFRDLHADPAWSVQYCYATRLAYAAVFAAKGKAAGKAEDLVFDRFTLLPAFVQIRYRGELYPVPTAALDIQMKGPLTKSPKVFLAVPVAKLVAAPQVGAKKRQKLTHPRFRARVYKHFGVARPIYEGPIQVKKE